MDSRQATFKSYFFDHFDGVILVSPQGKVLEMNRSAERMLGYSRDDLIDKENVQIIDLERVDPGIIDMMTRSVLGGEHHLADLYAKKKDGRSFPIEILMSKIQYLGEDVIAYTLRDITMRNEVDAAMRESEERYRSLVDLSPFAIFIVVHGKISYLNPAAVTLLHGERQHEIIGQPVTSFIHPDQRKEFLNCLSYRDPEGQRELANTVFLDVQQKKLHVEAICLPIMFKGVPATQIIGLDVTERSFLEEQLRQSQKLEAIGLLAGGVAHDFNNILTGIIGYAGLGLGLLDKEHPAFRFFSQIEGKSQEAAKLVHQLLAFSRKDMLSFTKLDLNDIVTSSAEFLGRVLPEDIDFNTSTSGQECQINADPVALQQIITNLCVNAKDAMPEGGSIFVSTDIVELEENSIHTSFEYAPGPFVKLTVKDMGTGMNDDVLEHMYDPFFTTKEIGQGSGLGLSMIYGLVKQHKGMITCQSLLGEGTIFDIYFPLISAPRTISSVERQNPAMIEGRETILLVEDDIDVLTILQGILETSGYTVKMAKNGKVALDILAAHRDTIDLVITDLIMPEMSGTELFKRAEHLPWCPDFLYISGYARDAELRTLKLGKDVEFMKKPFTAAELNHKVRKVLDKDKLSGKDPD